MTVVVIHGKSVHVPLTHIYAPQNHIILNPLLSVSTGWAEMAFNSFSININAIPSSESTYTHFHRTSINYLLVNLAVADMMLATFFAPQYIFIHTFTHPDGVAGDVLCRLLTDGSLAWVGGAASVFTLVAIAIERYYAVLHPYGHKGKLTHRKLKVCLKEQYHGFREHFLHGLKITEEEEEGAAFTVTPVNG